MKYEVPRTRYTCGRKNRVFSSQERLALQRPDANIPRRPPVGPTARVITISTTPFFPPVGVDEIRNSQLNAVSYARMHLTRPIYKKPFRLPFPLLLLLALTLKLLCLAGTSIFTSPTTLAGRTELALRLPPPPP